MDLKYAMNLVKTEYLKAATIHEPMHSYHEGYAVILEELDEMKEEIWKRSEYRDTNHLKQEAVEVAAMALRFLVDLT